MGLWSGTALVGRCSGEASWEIDRGAGVADDAIHELREGNRAISKRLTERLTWEMIDESVS